MIRPPPRPTRPETHCPFTTFVRYTLHALALHGAGSTEGGDHAGLHGAPCRQRGGACLRGCARHPHVGGIAAVHSGSERAGFVSGAPPATDARPSSRNSAAPISTEMPQIGRAHV